MRGVFTHGDDPTERHSSRGDRYENPASGLEDEHVSDRSKRHKSSHKGSDRDQPKKSSRSSGKDRKSHKEHKESSRKSSHHEHAHSDRYVQLPFSRALLTISVPAEMVYLSNIDLLCPMCHISFTCVRILSRSVESW